VDFVTYLACKASMMPASAVNPSRRAVIAAGGAFILSFSLVPHRLAAQGAQNAELMRLAVDRDRDHDHISVSGPEHAERVQ
jgi:hypothetical protein